MTEKKKVPPPVVETGDGVGQTVLGEFVQSQPKNTMRSGMWQDLLPHSRESALTGDELARLLGLTRREVTRSIMEARRAGVPILSDPAAGYWLSWDKEERRRCAADLRRRAKEILQTAAALEV